MSGRYLILIALLPIVLLSIFQWHNYQLKQFSIEFSERDKVTMMTFHHEYDSFVTQLYIQDPEYAVAFEDLFDKSYVLPSVDTFIKTLFFNDKIAYIKYNKNYFNCFRNIAEIEIENVRTKLRTIEQIFKISDEYGDYGDEWRPKMLDEEFSRFFSISLVDPKDCDVNVFKRKKIEQKTFTISGYRLFLNDYKLKVEEQDSVNKDALSELIFLLSYAEAILPEYRYNNILNSEYLDIDSLTVRHKFQDNYFGDIEFTTTKLILPIEQIRDMIFD
jgi:hypothetical protein